MCRGTALSPKCLLLFLSDGISQPAAWILQCPQHNGHDVTTKQFPSCKATAKPIHHGCFPTFSALPPFLFGEIPRNEAKRDPLRPLHSTRQRAGSTLRSHAARRRPSAEGVQDVWAGRPAGRSPSPLAAPLGPAQARCRFRSCPPPRRRTDAAAPAQRARAQRAAAAAAAEEAGTRPR